MARIFSPKAELTVLRGMLHSDRTVVGTILSSIDESYFYREESKEIYNHVRQSISEEGVSPKLKILLEDPGVSKDAREFLRDAPDSIESATDAAKAVRILRKFRKMRGLHEIMHDINTELDGDKIDPDKLLEKLGEKMVEVRQTKSQDNAFLHFGTSNNSMEFVRELIYEGSDAEIIPTGIKAFDDTNLGFMRGSLVIIGGNSGAGKSHVATALCMNMAEMGYRVLLVPLEMNKKEMTARILANACKVDSLKINGNQLSTEGKDKLMEGYKKWVRRIKKKGGRFTIFKPDSDLTIEEAYAAISTYQCDVVVIDYVTLLKGTDGPDQWKDLGKVARIAKINAELNNRVNILLSQVDDTGKIRYSQTVKEHASNAWIFVADKDSKEQGILKIEQIKSRNQVAYPFTIKIEYKYSTIGDVDQDYVERKPDQDFSMDVKNLAAD